VVTSPLPPPYTPIMVCQFWRVGSCSGRNQ